MKAKTKYNIKSDLFPFRSKRKLEFLLSVPREEIEHVAKTAGQHYSPFDICSQDKIRHIDNPLIRIKKLQRKIKENVLSTVEFPVGMNGGLSGRSTKDNAEKHTKKQVVVTIDIKNKPIGYGQTSFYLAYEDMKNKLKWGDVPLTYASPHMRDDDIVWSGNSPKGKVENLRLCKLDFEARR